VIRLPGLTPYGMREILIAFVITAALCGLFYWLGARYTPWIRLASILPLALFAWVLLFFRDPARIPPENPKAILSPADGTITHIEEVDEPTFIGGRAKMIGIFLSIFDVHLNRAPFPGKVEYIKYTPGKFHDARTEESSGENENTAISFSTGYPGAEKILVKQIAGAIARRIVTDIEEGQAVKAGECIGMIKFGSRTEIYLPAGAPFAARVKVGDTVRAGTTVLGELE
jgi:phosphatidylserine decarboxylase